jgi:glutaredoxin
MGIIFKLNLVVLKETQMKNLALLIFFFLTPCTSKIVAQSVQVKTNEKTALIVYGSDGCHHCIDTKKYLTERNISLVFYDIDKNNEALQEMLGKLRKAGLSTSNLGIPVIDKQSEVFTNVGVFEEFLKKLN